MATDRDSEADFNNTSSRDRSSVFQFKPQRFRPPDPFAAPRLIHRCCNIRVLLAVLVAIRLILGVLCCSWAVTNLSNAANSFGTNKTKGKYNLDELFTPDKADESDNFRFIASLIYFLDILLCIIASLLEYCTPKLKRILALYIIWFLVILVSFPVYIWGAYRFVIRKQYRFIYYVDFVTLPLILVIIVFHILWLRSLLQQGYVAFHHQTSNELPQTGGREELDPDVDEMFSESPSSRPGAPRGSIGRAMYYGPDGQLPSEEFQNKSAQQSVNPAYKNYTSQSSTVSSSTPSTRTSIIRDQDLWKQYSAHSMHSHPSRHRSRSHHRDRRHHGRKSKS